MWAHTVVNEFAGGVFPGISEITDDPSVAIIAARHLLVEGYIADATPGYDGTRTRATAGSGDPQRAGAA